ncbi:hypothetical protein HJFPF1_11124 [Paramyrothecium foliicola]|nr:hypothetical protein HJFPF1_11124 [Paramyrothecium foliicola]
MGTTTTSPVLSGAEKAAQIYHISTLSLAIKSACKVNANDVYRAGPGSNEAALASYPMFLQKLAQICDFQKGGGTEIALTALKTKESADYWIISNSKHGTEQAAKFLGTLLREVGANPGKIKEKALQKRVLWSILEFNFERINIYLKTFCKVLDECIGYAGDAKNIALEKQLRLLREKAWFSRDMTASLNAQQKFLSDCETLIKTIHNMQGDETEGLVEKHASSSSPDQASSWSQFRRYTARLHSYRHASEIIVSASKTWPSLFHKFTIRSLASSRQLKTPSSVEGASVTDVIQGAFPNSDTKKYEAAIAELEVHHLRAEIEAQNKIIPKKTIIHCEVALHEQLVRRGKTDPSDFCNDVSFIATSKPPCRLCQLYYENSVSEFEMQASKGHIYLDWRLPELVGDPNSEAKDRHDSTVDDLVHCLQRDVSLALRKKLAALKMKQGRADSKGNQKTVVTPVQGKTKHSPGMERNGHVQKRTRYDRPIIDEDADGEGEDVGEVVDVYDYYGNDTEDVTSK